MTARTLAMDLHPVWEWFLWLHEATGIKLTIFYDAFDRARFWNGFLTSVRLMAICVAASVAIGVIGAWAQGARLRLLRLAMQGYIQFFRNTPPLRAALLLLLRARQLPAHDDRDRPLG